MKKQRYRKKTGRSLKKPLRYGGKKRKLRFQPKIKLPNFDRWDIGGILSWIVQIVIVCFVAFVLVWFWGQRVSNTGSSMQPALNNGDIVLVDRIIYNASRPDRFDVIVFKPNGNENSNYYIKRIIGLPGETVQIKDGYVYVNGEELEELIHVTEVADPGLAVEEIKLAGDEYFVLGDNRNHSSDSRDPSVGVLTREDLIGRAWVRIYPFSEMGVIRHE